MVHFMIYKSCVNMKLFRLYFDCWTFKKFLLQQEMSSSAVYFMDLIFVHLPVINGFKTNCGSKIIHLILNKDCSNF